jgi:LacI family transcriptional regulator
VLSSVVVDDEGASRKAVEHLLSLGHRVIGGVFGPREIDTAVRRKRGFSAAIAAAKLRPIAVDLPSWGAEEGYTGARQLLRKYPAMTAIYASTFLMGIGVLRAAFDEHRPVPSSLSVLCLHDSSLAEYLVPPLSTVRLPTEAMGTAAVELLVARAQGGPEQAIMIDGDGEIVSRASTGPT